MLAREPNDDYVYVRLVRRLVAPDKSPMCEVDMHAVIE